MKKSIGLLLVCTALLSVQVFASPPTPDVGKEVVLVDDCLQSNVNEIIIKQCAIVPMEYLASVDYVVFTSTENLRFENAVSIVTPVFVVPVSPVPPERCCIKANYFHSTTNAKKIYLYNCAIRQCTGEAVAAAASSHVNLC